MAKAEAKQSTAIPNQNHRTPSSTTTIPTITICSSFLREVCLHDWWLIKAEMDSKGRQLGVGGFASRERQGIRVFHSAAIAKRHDTTTLETVDGITIKISGFINRSHTHQSGFPSEVCNHFLFGFPYYWEEYAAQCFGEEYMSRAVPSRMFSLHGFNMSSNDGANSLLPISLDNLPVTRIHDILMCTLGDSENYMLTKNVFNDILQKYSGNAFKHSGPSVHSNKEINGRVMSGDSVPDEPPSNHEKGHSETFSALDASGNQRGGMETRRNASNVNHATVISEEEIEVKESTGKSAVRRSIRLKNQSDPISTSEASRHQFGRMETRQNASHVCHEDIISGQEREVRESSYKSAVRRSNRLKKLKK